MDACLLDAFIVLLASGSMAAGHACQLYPTPTALGGSSLAWSAEEEDLATTPPENQWDSPMRCLGC